jgi:glyoxylase-like metal-dependent hydrolase (beta-lactamase superfamily II)
MERAPGHDDIVRIVAPNPGPMTLEGTNTYVVGSDPAYVIDPGPAIDSHLDAIRETAGEIAGILLTHSHSDHSEAAPVLGAPLVWGEVGETDEFSAGAPTPPAPPAEKTVGPFTVIPTPGHAEDHVVLVREDVCFCGDLILGFGSSIVPPAAGGGSLVEYMASLRRVSGLAVDLMCPGHGPWITEPQAKVDEYVAHRLEREEKLVRALEAGERSPERLLDAAWDDVPEGLRPAAAMAMQAHLEKLAAEGRLPDGVTA